MFNVIRIPTKFSKTIKRFSQKDKSELLGMLIDIWEWIEILVPDTIVWDTLSLIYGEWMNMESKNWNKPKKSLLVLEPSPSNSDTRVEYNRIEENNNIQIENLIKKWNNLKTYDEFWKWTKWKDNVIKILNNIFKKYSIEDIETWVKNYLRDIKERKDWSYKNHRFTIEEFFTRERWFKKFYNII